jgi:hypothetical protein
VAAAALDRVVHLLADVVAHVFQHGVRHIFRLQDVRVRVFDPAGRVRPPASKQISTFLRD